MRIRVLALASLASITTAFFLPGLVPKSYSYSDKLPISMSSELTSTVPLMNSFSANNKATKPWIHISHDTLLEYKICDPLDGFKLHKEKHSSTTGYFSEKTINSAYTANLTFARDPLE